MKWIGIGLGLLAAMSYAVEVPTPLSSDDRIRQVVFSPDNVVEVDGSPLVTTQIIFAEDEAIKEVQNGDMAGWTTSINANLPNMIFLKPAVKDSQTNMTVVTNHHVYYFGLTAREGDSAIYAIRFLYPEEVLTQAGEEIALKTIDRELTLSIAENPSKFNWDYRFNGDKTVVPLHAFDDGKFTYFQLAPGQPVPAVFVVNNPEGKEAVANVRMEGRYLVIQQLAPQFTLRLGTSHVASIFNDKQIARIEGGAR